jgi:regulator of protease activity HflC (stomatin/prohibitin superfamily)
LYFAFAILMILIFIGCLASPIFTRSGITAGFAAIPLLLFVIVTVVASATTVGARSVGIETSFGQYRATLHNGLNWTAPWASVEQFSTQLQTNKLQKTNGDAGAVEIAFKGASSGSADVTIRWSITENGAEALWKSFKTFDNVRDNLVESEARNATRDVFSQYAPADAIDGSNLTQIDKSIRSQLESTLQARGISVDSINITNIDLGAQAQESINRIVSANANTQTAEANLNTAKVESQTAQIQAQSQTAQTLQRHCLDIVEAWNAAKQGPLPATFNCDLTSTGQPPVIVQGK